MPYKSDAQRRYFHAAAARGEISKKKVQEFDEASKGKQLPERLWEGGYAEGGPVISKEEAEKLAKALGMPQPAPRPKPQGYFEGGTVRYRLQDKLMEYLRSQVNPEMSSEDGSKHTEHNDSPMPEEGYDRYMTVEPGDEHGQEGDEDALSRQELLMELRRRKYKRQ